jgi:hypothetical protein
VPRATRTAPLGPVAFALAAVLLVALVPAPAARAASPPVLPIPLDPRFLTNLSAPSVTPGGSGRIVFGVSAPAVLAAPLVGAVLTIEVYAFNGYPGNASAQLPVRNAPVLSNSTASGALVTVSLGTLPAGATHAGSVGFSTSSDTPTGTFALRTALAFTLNGSGYRLASRGWFTQAAWDRATELPNGSATLNLSVLGVSGVIPETGLLVRTSDWPWALGALLAGAFVLLGVGAWVYARRGPGSRSGAG